MIRIRNLSKRFNNTLVLDGIDLDIEDGERIVLIGPSGTGKSTLLRCLNFLETPDEGEVTIGELTVNVRTARKESILALRRKTAFVFQNYALFANKTARENITEGLITVRGWPQERAVARANEILENIGMPEKGDAYPASLSGGQQQRIGIGRAMALDAQLMLFDEPTSALDPEWIDEILQLMKRIADARQTMLIVTHEMQFAQDIADRVIFMDGGRIVEQGAPETIFTEPNDARTRSFLRKVLLNSK
jgi:putative amino-acid transport system ATP-binding protein